MVVFIGKRKLGFVVRIKGGLVVAWRRVWPCARLWEHAYLAGGIVCSRLSASRSHRKVTVCTPRRRGVPFTRVKGTKTRLGLCPKAPFSLSCGWIRTMRSIVRTAPQIRSQGACGAFYFGPSRNQIKNQPYKRRLIPLREYEVFPGGMYRRVGGLGVLPE